MAPAYQRAYKSLQNESVFVRIHTLANQMTDSRCPADPAEDSIGRILRERHPRVRLRKKFLSAPFLDQVTLGQLLADPFAITDFLAQCRRQPHCGDGSILSLRQVLEIEAAGYQEASTSRAVH
jgi:hypothetical protein